MSVEVCPYPLRQCTRCGHRECVSCVDFCDTNACVFEDGACGEEMACVFETSRDPKLEAWIAEREEGIFKTYDDGKLEFESD